MLDDYRTGGRDWARYERRFRALMLERRLEDALSPSEVDNACLPCSEHTPDRCHRRLLAEYWQAHSGDLEIVHL